MKNHIYMLAGEGGELENKNKTRGRSFSALTLGRKIRPKRLFLNYEDKS